MVMREVTSSKPRRQRKWRYDKPLHISYKDFSAHLSKELRSELGKRSIEVRKGDTVKVMRGDSKVIGKGGKVTQVLRNKRMVLVEGIIAKKSNGTERFIPLRPSKLLIVALDEKDSRRLKKKGKKSEKAVKQNGK
ncbi:MAG TPA: 50S ribosomal protein L24 [archaeon]|nr:50S ribosomal protein L24 [archaeon]